MNYRYPKVEGNVLVNYESRYSGYRKNIYIELSPVPTEK